MKYARHILEDGSDEILVFEHKKDRDSWVYDPAHTRTFTIDNSEARSLMNHDYTSHNAHTKGYHKTVKMLAWLFKLESINRRRYVCMIDDFETKHPF